MTDSEHAASGDWIGTALSSYEGDLVRYAQRIVGDSERARDVVQETFLKLCRTSPAEVDGHLAKWLYTVCRNRALDVLRKESRMSPLVDTAVMEDTVSTFPQPGDVAQQRDEVTEVRRHLSELPANQSRVIRLKFERGLSYREISQVTGLSVTNVGFLIHQGLKTLRRRLSD